MIRWPNRIHRRTVEPDHVVDPLPDPLGDEDPGSAADVYDAGRSYHLPEEPDDHRS